jgi:hypothetical protein
MSPHVSFQDVFQEFGKAAYLAQIMEYDIISLWMLDAVTQGVTLTRADLMMFQKDWGKKTFGQLLNPLQKSNLISDEIKNFLEQLREARNTLVHGFFLATAADLQSSAGRERIVAGLQHRIELFREGKRFFGTMLTTYLKDFGVDAEEIRRQILANSKDAEPVADANAGTTTC